MTAMPSRSAARDGLLWSRHQTLLAPRIVPAARRLPYRFISIVSQVDQG
jgi:hypothetical protein